MTPSTAQAEKARSFLDLHVPGRPLLMPNAWDIGSARLFANVGCEAIATTSGGFALTQGRLDGAMTGDEVLAHCADLSAAVDVPVSADLENCFADEPLGVAETIHRAIEQGLAGGSVEDFTRNSDDPIYELGLAADRVRAAAEAAHNGPVPFVLTARAENYLHGRVDLADTIARLQAYQEAGADVLFAPRVVDPDELRTLLAAVDRPVNVLLTPARRRLARWPRWAWRVSRSAVPSRPRRTARRSKRSSSSRSTASPTTGRPPAAARADIAAAFVKP